MSSISISTVTPVYQGEKYLKELIEEIEETRELWKAKYDNLEIIESIFVIDDAKDNSYEVLNTIAKNKDWIVIIELSKNFGQHAATTAGILYTSGDWVFTIDEDCQHKPENFELFLRKVVSEQDDICYAKAIENVHGSWIKDRIASTFKLVISKILFNKHILNFNSFRLIRGDVARAAASISRQGTYFDIVLTWFSTRITNIPIQMLDQRNQNNNDSQSGYSLMGLIKHGLKMIMTTNLQILRIAIIIGFVSFIISLGSISYTLLDYFFFKSHADVRGWLSLFSTILFFGAISSLLLSIILEITLKTLQSNNGKPTFFILDRTKDLLLKSIFKKNP